MMSLEEIRESKIDKGKVPEEQGAFDVIRKVSNDSLSQQRDNLDRPKKASELFREYIVLEKGIEAIQTKIHELSKSSGIDFLSDAQRHLQIAKIADHQTVWDTANKTFRQDEPSEEQREKNKKLLEKYVISAKKIKDFLVAYQEAVVVFKESVEKAASTIPHKSLGIHPARPRKVPAHSICCTLSMSW